MVTLKIHFWLISVSKFFFRHYQTPWTSLNITWGSGGAVWRTTNVQDSHSPNIKWTLHYQLPNTITLNVQLSPCKFSRQLFGEFTVSEWVSPFSQFTQHNTHVFMGNINHASGIVLRDHSSSRPNILFSNSAQCLDRILQILFSVNMWK